MNEKSGPQPAPLETPRLGSADNPSRGFDPIHLVLGPSDLPDADPPADLADTDALFRRACEDYGVDPDIAEAFGWKWEPDSRDLPWTKGPFKGRGYAGLTGTRPDGKEWFAPHPPDVDAGIYVAGDIKSGVDLLPGADTEELHVAAHPMTAAALRGAGVPSVGWIPGRKGWRGPHRKLCPDIAGREPNSVLVLHPEPLCWTDPDVFREWERFAEKANDTGLRVSVETESGRMPRTKAFAATRRPPTPAEARAAAEEARLSEAGPAGAAPPVPGPVKKALSSPVELLDKGSLNADLAARAVIDCFDGHIACSPAGPYVYDDSGLWVPGYARDGLAGAVGRVIRALLRSDFKDSHEKTILSYLSGLPTGIPLLRNEPKNDGWSGTLNFRNGLMDVGGWELRPHDPSCLSTWQIPVAFESDAECPWFRRWLAEALPEDMLVERDGVAPWQEDLGYMLLPGNPFHVALLLRGGGRNGKGVWMTVVTRMVGHTHTTSLGLEDLVDPSQSRFRAVELVGSAVNIAGEVDPKYIRSTGMFKSIVAGDPITVEKKFGASWPFRPWTTLVFSANENFASVDRTTAYFDRWQVRDYPNYVPVEKRIVHLGDKIADAELPGITAAAVAGLRRVMERGHFPETESSQAKHAEFRTSSDHQRRFIEEAVRFKVGYSDLRRDVHGRYVQWCQDEALRPLGASKLFRAIVEIGREHGVEVDPEVKPHRGGRRIVGASLVPADGGGVS